MPPRRFRRRFSDPIPDTNFFESSLPTPSRSSGSFTSKTPSPSPSLPSHQTNLSPSTHIHYTRRATATTGCSRGRGLFGIVSPRCFRAVMAYIGGRSHAHGHVVAPAISGPLRKRSGNMQQRRLDLEHEVAELQKQLSNEQKVHEILERALQPNSARSVIVSIPAFIPKKAKELLAELVVVEEEIARLESEIHKMQEGLSAMREARAKTSRYSQENASAIKYANHSASTPSRPPDLQSLQGKVVPEIKSMFFISQAMNKEYLKRHLVDEMVQEKMETPRVVKPDEIFSRTNGMIPKNAVFSLPPRPSFDKPSDAYAEKPSKIFQEPSTNQSPKKKDDQKIQPNKLSERIMKCLICIFLRLIRTSRAVEIEKSSNLARSTNSFLNPGSFRIDSSVNLTVSIAKEKDKGQQDHYGIFEIQDSLVREIGPYKNLVRFTSSSFDLRGLSSSSLLSKLRGMLETLQQVDLRLLTHQQKLAFWLNMYNTCIMHGILQHGLPSNSEKLLALKNKAILNVGGQKFNALVIENFILRQPSRVKEEFWKCDIDVEEQKVRSFYGLDNAEPNILFALCCGSRSSPAVRIYKPDRVTIELEKAKLDYLQASLVVTSTRRLMIPSLIHSNTYDFATDLESLVRWITDQLPTSWSLRRSMVECLRVQSHLKINEFVDVIPYDYEFQYLLPM